MLLILLSFIQLQKNRQKIAEKWTKKLANSPFNVDLVAEDERIYEENRLRQEEDRLRQHQIHERKDKLKNEILLKVGIDARYMQQMLTMLYLRRLVNFLILSHYDVRREQLWRKSRG